MKAAIRLVLFCLSISSSLSLQAQDPPVVLPPIWHGVDWTQGALQACRDEVAVMRQGLPPEVDGEPYVDGCWSQSNHWVQTAWFLKLLVRIEYVDENDEPQVFGGLIPGSKLESCERYFSLGKPDYVLGCQEVFFQSDFEDPLQCPPGMVLNTKFVCVAQDLHSSNYDGCTVGNPINIMHGNKFEQVVDYVLPGPVPFEFSRTYNSINGGWTFSFDVSMHATKFSSSDNGKPQYGLIAYRPDGTKWSLAPDSSGRNLRSPHGVIEDFIFSGGVVKLQDMTNGTVETYGYDGKRQYIRFPSGQDVVASVDTYYPANAPIATNMTLITRLYGRPSTIQDALGDVKVRYFYDVTGNLAEVQYKGGRVVQYLYENQNFPTALTGILESGIQKSAWEYDSQGRAISSSHLNGQEEVDRHTIEYLSENESTKLVETTNALGKKTRFHYQKAGGEVRLTQIEGIATDSCLPSNSTFTYYPSGFLETSSENGVITKYEYNQNNQVIKKIEALGTPQERSTVMEWHPNFEKLTSISNGITKTVFSYNEEGLVVSKKIIKDN